MWLCRDTHTPPHAQLRAYTPIPGEGPRDQVPQEQPKSMYSSRKCKRKRDEEYKQLSIACSSTGTPGDKATIGSSGSGNDARRIAPIVHEEHT